ncbi:MAG: hypothetical protein LBV36_02075, partial [Chromatiales bacterium]|nr:hypothetical protein [Chromatiales bacterium]
MTKKSKSQPLRGTVLAGACILIAALAVGVLDTGYTGVLTFFSVWFIPFATLLLVLLHFLVLKPLHAQASESSEPVIRTHNGHDLITGLPNDPRMIDAAWVRE